MQIEDHLYGKKLHLPLLGEKPKKMLDEDWALLDRQETTTTALMKILSDMCEKPFANNKVHLMKKKINLKMREGAFMTEHMNDFNTLINQLSFVKIDFDEEVHALIFLASLPNSWELMRAAISNLIGNVKLKLTDVRDKIIVEEVRKKDSSEITSNALNVKTRGRGYDRNSN
ncbi:hypothetical protein Patl1_36722 [Pistacia atlantica]|nr:hypothetical protein Patl1_36722 [Pistacia atlantica]